MQRMNESILELNLEMKTLKLFWSAPSSAMCQSIIGLVIMKMWNVENVLDKSNFSLEFCKSFNGKQIIKTKLLLFTRSS